MYYLIIAVGVKHPLGFKYGASIDPFEFVIEPLIVFPLINFYKAPKIYYNEGCA